MKEAADISATPANGRREDEGAIDGRQAQAIARETAASPGKGELRVKGRPGWEARLPRAAAAHRRRQRRQKAAAQDVENIEEPGVRAIVRRLIRQAAARETTRHAQPNSGQ
ncbi:hypothetical protein [Methylobacterium segetis]|uniref:hypothetical protein n=1 Tax=Methylobacterium segetis TaxID=2488750 RepID=UPI00104B71FA|nr:hypothetical protein [Methylobacterium segetis]